MKKSILFLFTVFILSGQILAQDKLPKKANKFNFGFHLNQYQNDFGLGLNITSPFFGSGLIAIRGRASFQFHEYQNTDSTTTWTPYGNYQLGVVAVGGTAGGFARFYGEGGLVLLTPSSDFSSSGTEIGGYGLFGFEFFLGTDPNTPITYYIELGGMGTGANADKVAGSPIYSNGFTISTGFRLYL